MKKVKYKKLYTYSTYRTRNIQAQYQINWSTCEQWTFKHNNKSIGKPRNKENSWTISNKSVINNRPYLLNARSRNAVRSTQSINNKYRILLISLFLHAFQANPLQICLRPHHQPPDCPTASQSLPLYFYLNFP